MKRFPRAAVAVVSILALWYSFALALWPSFAFAQAPAAKKTPPAASTPTKATPAAPPAGAKAGNAPASTGTSDRLDGIAAVVNDDIILESDVEEQLYLFITQARIRPDSVMVDSMRTDLLSQLIDFRLVVAEAKRQGMTLTASDEKMVSMQADESIKQSKARFPSEAEFQQALARENTSVTKLREKYRHDLSEQLLAQRLRDKQIPKHAVSATEAEAYFKANPDKFPRLPAQVKLQVIQIPPQADSIADAKARARCLDIKKRLTAGEKFAKVAAEASEDEGSARSGGDLGFLPRGTLDVAFDTAIDAAKLNTVNGPVRSSAGWHLFEVLDRDTVKARSGRDSLDAQKKPVTEAHVRHILVRVPLDDGDIDRARKIADRVRADAAKGGDFGALARRYSKYQGQVDPDGDLGYVPMSAFQTNIRGAIDSVQVGEVSRVLENPVGFNIFKVNDRKPERPYQLDEVREQLPVAVEEIKDRERWEAWVKTLRNKAHIEIRGS